MENWGLITYGWNALLLNPDAYTVQQLTSVAVVVAHELAHQWFGNIVTASWWSHLWLNEGFATSDHAAARPLPLPLLR
jgi:aminopeptidase N